MDAIAVVQQQYPWLITLAQAVAIIAVTWVVERAAYRGVRHLGASENVTLPGSSIFANIARVCIWVIGIAELFKVCFNYDVTGLVAALGVGGIALSLGLQDTLSNLIGGLQVSLGRIVEPGQYIQVLGQTGRVQDVSWRHTTIVDAGGNTYMVPNSVINKNSLMDVGDALDVRAGFLLPMDADIEAFSREAVQQVTQAFAGDLGPAGVRVCFTGDSESGIMGNVVVNVLRSAYAAESGADHAYRAVHPVVRKYCEQAAPAATPAPSVAPASSGASAASAVPAS